MVVVDGNLIFKLADTHGFSITDSMIFVKNNNAIIDWLKFIETAIKYWDLKTIRNRVYGDLGSYLSDKKSR